jgi:glucose-1-phosphate cytidylyltransferase
MKTIILAGGLGTRISEETDTKPKPMVLLDDKPILWHIMNIFSTQGYDDFIIATGYKGEVIHDWVRSDECSQWKINALDTGLNTMTGGRIKRCMEIWPGEPMMATYGDGVGNINITKLLEFHRKHSKMATVTAVRPPARFGVLESLDGVVTHFGEKNQTDAGWINGGFFVLSEKIPSLIKGDDSVLESEVLPQLVKIHQLMSFHHEGFWQPMDTLRERNELSALAKLPSPPWVLH